MANCKYNFYTCCFIGQVSFCSDCEYGSNYQESYYFENMKKEFEFIKADRFFPTYLPHIKSYKHKLRGKNGRGNPTEFNETEKKEIKAALKKLFKDLIG